MSRKKWTPKQKVDDSIVQSREKRKWQIALRRYVLEQNKSSTYAPYFGLETNKFREWIEIQFGEDLTWANFSSHWQFDHIVPVAYFDFHEELDLKLCWNFVNIQVVRNSLGKNKTHRLDVSAIKKYFEDLYNETGFWICKQMVEKITSIEHGEAFDNTAQKRFILTNKEYLDAVKDLNSSDFDRLNTGTSLKSLLFEKDFIKRLGE